MLPEGFLLKLLDVTQVGLVYIDESGLVQYYNEEACKLLGMKEGLLFSRSVLSCHPAKLHNRVQEKIEDLKETSCGSWHRVIKRNGLFLENYYSSLFIDNVYKGIVIVAKDVTERETLTKALQNSYKEVSVLYEAAQIVNSSLNVKQVLNNVVSLAQQVVGFDAGGIILYNRTTNDIVCNATYNYSDEQIKNLEYCQPFGEVLATVEEGQITAPVESHFTCSAVSKMEMAVPMIISDDIYGVWFVENHYCERFADDQRNLLHALANLTTSALKNALLFERTRTQATVDQLTGLYNRHWFDQLLEQEKEKALIQQIPLSVIMADLNRLKYINDTFGHKMGDYVIRETADLLKRSVRQWEPVCRYGGDEMIILMPNCNEEMAAMVTERIKNNARSWNKKHAESGVFLHLSVGFSTARTAAEMDNVVKLADEAMYNDKRKYYKRLDLTR